MVTLLLVPRQEHRLHRLHRLHLRRRHEGCVNRKRRLDASLGRTFDGRVLRLTARPSTAWTFTSSYHPVATSTKVGTWCSTLRATTWRCIQDPPTERRRARCGNAMEECSNFAIASTTRTSPSTARRESGSTSERARENAAYPYRTCRLMERRVDS